MDVFDPQKLEYESFRLREDEVQSLCDTLCIKQQTHLACVKFRASGVRSIHGQLNKLLVVVDTLLPNIADCQCLFSAMNNIICDIKKVITTNKAEKQLSVSTVEPQCEKWNPELYST